METKIIEINPSLAKIYLESNTKNRNLNQKTVLHYSNQMQRGQWRLTGQGISFSKSGRLLDGQHRLSAVIHSGVTITQLVISGLDEDSINVYDTGKLRTASDVLSLNSVKYSSAISAQIKTFISFTRGNLSVTQSSSQLKVSNQDILDIYGLNRHFWIDTEALSRKCWDKYRVLTPSTMGGFAAYLIRTLGKNERTVKSFFLELSAIDPDVCSATELLREILIKNMTSVKKMSVSHKNLLLKKAWEYYETGKNVKSLRVTQYEKKQIEGKR